MTGPLYPGPGLFPGPGLYPSGATPIGNSGNPTGYDESTWWGTTDNGRPDALKWLAVSLLTGQIICDLPGIVSHDPTRRTIGQYESLTANLVVDQNTSPSWLTATRPFTSALIAYRGLPGAEIIYWGGIVLRRQRTFGGNVAQLSLATPECYLDRRYTGAYTTDPGFIGARRDQNLIVSDLVTQFAADTPGLPITVTVLSDGNPVPTLFEIYNNYDDKTVYSNISTLFALLGGPEWTGHWTWNRVSNTIRPVLYVGNHIGFRVPAGLGPRAVFDSANLITGTLDENYSAGMGGNITTATSSGQGLARPQAVSPATPVYDGRPRIEYRFSPSTSIQDPVTLQGHADRANTLLTAGTNTVTLRAAAAARPHLGDDWNLGDDIGWVATGPLFPGDMTGTNRCIGYEADDFYTSPVLYVPKPL